MAEHLKRMKRLYSSYAAVRDMSRTPGFLRTFLPGWDKHTAALVRPGLVHKLVAPAVRGRVLEVGIGGGPLTEKLKKARNVEIYGVDISTLLLEKARKRGAVPIAAAGEFLPLKRNSFDSAVSLDMLGHVEEPERVLREMRRALKPGGRLVVGVSEKGPWSGISGGTGPLAFSSYSIGEVRRMFRRSGLKVDKIRRAYIVPTAPISLFVYARKPSLRTRRLRGRAKA